MALPASSAKISIFFKGLHCMNSFDISTPVKTTSTAALASKVNPVARLNTRGVVDFRTLDAGELQLVGGGDVAVSIR
jgi:hypothetical protein